MAESKIRDLDWEKTARFCFNEKSNPDDDELGSQIVKVLQGTELYGITSLLMTELMSLLGWTAYVLHELLSKEEL